MLKVSIFLDLSRLVGMHNNRVNPCRPVFFLLEHQNLVENCMFYILRKFLQMGDALAKLL